MLLYILLGVVLLGMVYFTFSRINSGSSNSLSKGKAKLTAQEIIEYSKTLQAGVAQLITKGCSESQLDFGNTVSTKVNGTPTNPDNTNARADGACALFKPTGLNLRVNNILYGAKTTTGPSSVKQGNPAIRVVQITGIGTSGAVGTTSANDLVLMYTGLELDLCMRLNTELGVANNGTDAPNYTYSGSTSNAFDTGTFVDSVLVTPTNPTPSFCTKSGSGLYNFYSVIYAR